MDIHAFSNNKGQVKREENMSVLVFDEELGRKIRRKNWSELTVSTYQLMIDAVQGDNIQEAIDLNEYFMDEALVCKRLFDQWARDTQKYLLFKGYGEQRLADLNTEIFKIIENSSFLTKLLVVFESVINTLWYSLAFTLKSKK